MSEVFLFQVGAFNCIAINDGDIDTILVRDFFDGAAEAELTAAWEEYGDVNSKHTIPVIVLYIDTGTHKILVDTGGGAFYDGAAEGLLLPKLQDAGIWPEEIDTVLLSHGHWDHVGGNIGPDGQAVYPNARFVMVGEEYEYWTRDEISGVNSENAFVQNKLLAVRDQLDLIGLDDEIVPGIQALPAPGHTLYHSAYRVRSGDETLICLMDTVDHPLHFEHVEWHAFWDMQEEQVFKTRRRLFQRAAEERALIHAPHLAFPGLGHVFEAGDQWRFEPLGKT